MPTTELLDWAEKAGIENLRGRLATGDTLLAQANTLLSILIVGIGGSLGYAVKLADTPTPTPVLCGMAAVTGWLAAVAAILAVRCVFTRETQVLYNEPLNLYQPESKLLIEELRVFELKNVQGRIDLVKKRNAAVATWLDRCRLASIATPVPFILAATVAAYR